MKRKKSSIGNEWWNRFLCKRSFTSKKGYGYWNYHAIGTKETEKQSACCNLDSITMPNVLSHFNIPHYTLNIRDDFKHHVIDYFVNEYLIGHTKPLC